MRVKQPQFREAFPEAVIREGADELTSRAEEVGSLRTFIDMKHIELERWGPPLVDAHWHAFCQAIYRGIEGKEWEALYYHYKESHQARAARCTSTVEVIGQDWSSEVAFLFEDWELALAALSCHMALDLLCQERRDACQDSSESQGSWLAPGKPTVKVCESFSLTLDGL